MKWLTRFCPKDEVLPFSVLRADYCWFYFCPLILLMKTMRPSTTPSAPVFHKEFLKELYRNPTRLQAATSAA